MNRLSPLRHAAVRRLVPRARPAHVHAVRWSSSPATPAHAPAAAPKRTETTSPMIPAAEAPGSVQPTVTGDVLSAAEYDRFASETMETLYDHLEALVEEWSPEGTHGWEIEYNSGVLTLSLGPHGTYVINKQPPTQQIWLSSPFSGPMRFSYITPHEAATTTAAAAQNNEVSPFWFYSRDKITLGALLDQEIRSVLAAEVGEAEAKSWPGVEVR